MPDESDPLLRPRFGRSPPHEAITLESEFPELSRAEFQRFLNAPNGPDAEPAVRRIRPGRRLRALLLLVGLLLVGIAVTAIARSHRIATETASRVTLLQLEVCRSLRALHRVPSELPNPCPSLREK
jgi:hypothetical protein